MSKIRERIIAQTENDMDRLMGRLEPKITRELVATARRWNKRWPRHRFKVQMGHGRLLVTVDPPICRKEFPTHIPGWNCRGAILDLQAEIEALDDWLSEVDYVVRTCAPDSMGTEDDRFV